jgi:protein-S-isoprenylcysteine O-methyltransferase Ste14
MGHLVFGRTTELAMKEEDSMKRASFLIGGAVIYAAFLATFLYAVGFVGNLLVPKSMDRGGEETSVLRAIAVDALLLTVFAVQHSGMARRGFKDALAKIVPRPLERSTYVLAASAALALLFWQWRPIGAPIWSIDDPIATRSLAALSLGGWTLVLIGTFHIDHFALFGLRQVYDAWAQRGPRPARFVTPGLYKWVRHPIYLGFLVAFWATPVMTAGHLVFAVATTGYILLGIRLEERDLVHEHGAEYERYRARVSMLAPGLKRPEVRAHARLER